MAVPGKFEVTPTGAADYTISIQVPPGTGGIVPSVALSYDSQGRNGLLGMGWQLEGLPSIGRCPRTYVQDWVRSGVNYDANDRFCLDGQRLVAISGTYGADGTEYRTEIDSFSKIISRGTAGAGPAWFEVWIKSGQRIEFGNTIDSRALAQGKTMARDWMVNKVSDTKGNYFTATYINDTINGQVYPSRIDYTGNAGTGLQPYNSVRFVYSATRPDTVLAWHAGSLMKTTVLLSNVQTFAGSTMVADYQLAYDQSPTTGRSRIVSVAQCDGGGSCVPPTAVAWQSGTTTPTVVANPGGQDGTLAGYRPHFGDFNGDGLPDVMWDKGGHVTIPSSVGTRVLWTNTGSGTFSVTGNFANQDGTLSGYAPLVADFNRDGRFDVWWFQLNASGTTTGPTYQWLSTSAGSYVTQTGTSAPFSNQWIVPKLAGTVDVNGDGRADVLWPIIVAGDQRELASWITQPDATVVLESQPGCGYPPGGCGGGPLLGALDLNGDGLSDVMWRNSVWRGNGNGTFSIVSGQLSGYSPNVVDVNGDGKSDVVWDKVDATGRSNGQRVLWLSKGDGTFLQQSNLAGQDGTLTGYRLYPTDVNGDGLADILWVQQDTNGLSSGARVLWLGKGDGTFTVLPNFAGQDGSLNGYVPILADLNGDGKVDILWDSRSGTDTRSTGTRVLWLSDGVPPDLMTSVTNGIGAKVSITYKSMTDSSVYSKESTAVDPLVDVQGPVPLVSQVDTTNGSGGTVSTGYAYRGAKAHTDGRGFLGFRQKEVTDLQTNVLQTTSYHQAFPMVGLVESESKKLGTQTLSQTNHSYQFLNASGASTVSQSSPPYRVSLTQSAATGSDLDGSPLPAVTTTYQHDTYGNPTRIAAVASDGHDKTTINTFTNDTAKWLLGRLTRATVKTCASGSCASCSLPWGEQIAHANTVTAYKETKATVTGCVSETRTCVDGSLSGDYQYATCTPYAPASMVFNGTNQALVRTLSTTSPTSTKLTYSLWVKLAGYDSKKNGTLFQVINAPTNSQWIVTGVLASGARVGIDQNWPTPNWGKHSNASPSFGTGAWHHIVWRYDSTIGPVENLGGSFRIRIYQNGVQLVTFTEKIPNLNAAHQLFTNGRQHQIGAWLDVSRFLKGKLAFVDVLQDISVGPEAFAFNNNGVWTRRPYTGPHGTYGFSLDGSTGVLGQDVGPNGQHFTGLNMTAANLDSSDLPPTDSGGGGAGFAAATLLKGTPAPTLRAADNELTQRPVRGVNHEAMK